jgi:segregation and condensation protein B
VEIDPHHLRLLEAVLFSAVEPMTEAALAERLPDGAPVKALLASLQDVYGARGVNLVTAGGRWFLRTAEDLSEELRVYMKVPRRLSRAAMETLAIVAYHQPVTRAEIEEIRGVGLSKGTLDALMEAGWVTPKGRRRTAGRPVTWGTTNGFLTTFGLEAIGDLPGLDDLRAAGLLDKRPAIQITDMQSDGDEEDPLEEDELLDMDLPDDQAPANFEGEGEGEGDDDRAAGEGSLSLDDNETVASFDDEPAAQGDDESTPSGSADDSDRS